MPIRAVDPASYRLQRWANGAGETRELGAGPERDDWRWRISIATVASGGPFSDLPDVERIIAPLDARLTLRFANGRAITLDRLQTFAFAGSPAPACELPDGGGRDINLMLRNGASGDLIVRPLVGQMLLPAAGRAWFVHLLSGHATLRADEASLDLAPDHSAWIDNPAHRIALEGGGEVALVRLDAE